MTSADPTPDPTVTSPAAPSPAESRGLDERKAAVLRAVVQQHVDTGLPVGSSAVSSTAGLGVSPATVRNDMSVLEREGYLTHPHTSAGRIPTDKGYRFYVDHLERTGSFDFREHGAGPYATTVREFFAAAHGELEQLLAQTSRLLASLTDHAAVVVAPAPAPACIRAVQLVDLAPGTGSSLLLVVVLETGAVEKRMIDVPAAVSDAAVVAAGVHLQTQLSGRPFGDPGPVLRTGDPGVDGLVDRCLAALSPVADASDPEVFVGGTAQIARGFDTVETVRAVLGVLEQHLVVVSLLREALERSASVSIGTEHGADASFEQLAACSVVVAPYTVDGRTAGTIGVLGPTRMNYPAVISAVADVDAQLSHRLSEG